MRRSSRSTRRWSSGSSFTVYSPGEKPDVAYREAVRAAQYERGHDRYSGTIATTHGYRVARNEPFPVTLSKYGDVTFSRELNEFIDKNIDRYEKWDACGAVPVTAEQVLANDTVTVTVEAKDEVEARKKGILLIKATGRVPPKASIVVEVLEGAKGMVLKNKGARISTWEVTGLRKQSLLGTIIGWVFFGWAAS